jgi:hypothetical protein
MPEDEKQQSAPEPAAVPAKVKREVVILQDSEGYWRRADNGKRVCGKKTAFRHTPCKRYPLKGFTVCKRHGGAGAKANMKHGLWAQGGENTYYLENEIKQHMERTDLKSLSFAVASSRAIFEKRLQELQKRNERAQKLDEKDFIRLQIERLQRYVDISERFKTLALTPGDHEWLAQERGVEELSEKDADALWRGIEFYTRAVERMVKIEDGLRLTLDIGGMQDLMQATSAAIKDAVREVVDEKTAEAVQVNVEGRLRRLVAVTATRA